MVKLRSYDPGCGEENAFQTLMIHTLTLSLTHTHSHTHSLSLSHTGLRMVKLGLYDPGFEEEIAFYTFDEIYSWGASDLQTFEFRVASERMPYSFKTMHAQGKKKNLKKI